VRIALEDLAEAHANGTPTDRLSAAGTALAAGATYDQVHAAMDGVTIAEALLWHAGSFR
jgi:hypothetical protein